MWKRAAITATSAESTQLCRCPRILSELDERGKTPLMGACLNNVDVIKFLLSNGVDLYARDSAGQTPFLHACRGNTLEVLAFLARREARMVCIMRQGVTRARYSNCRFKNYKQIFILKTGKTDFQFITLLRQAELITCCFYFRKVAA